MKLIPHDETMMLNTFLLAARRLVRLICGKIGKVTRVRQAYTEIEKEYFAVRNATGVFDISPMMKYRITGLEASAYLNRLVTRDMDKIKAAEWHTQFGG